MGPMEQDEDTRIYIVLINHEEQYSIWPKHKTIPAGWRAVGPEGRLSDCTKYVDEVWTDLRPLSLRKKMEESAQRPIGE